MSQDYNQYADHLAALRIIDANFNRAAEGLRAVEEYCRFALDDSHLTACCKRVRHQLADACRLLGETALVAARDTTHDVGTIRQPEDEETGQPADDFRLRHTAVANSERVKQALRAIEEYSKPLAAEMAVKIETLRYDWYTLEKAIRITTDSQQRLADARLYVLIDGESSECAFVERLRSLIEAGVHVLQLRDKRLDDRTLLERARLMRRVINDSASRPIFVMNDRPDLAVLSRADGVHVGQEELSVYDARRIVGPDCLVGVSTHTIEQARRAVLDGANYIGCGPTFRSATKQFDDFPGLDFLRQVAAEISLPAFAIGGITHKSLPQVLDAGIKRIAVSSAITESSDLEAEVNSCLTMLKKDT